MLQWHTSAQSPSYARRGLFRRLPRWAQAVVLAVLFLLLLPYLMTPLYTVGQPVSTLMLWRWVTGKRVERTFVPLENISPVLVRTVIAAEDGRFCFHHGLDLKEIKNAFDEAEDLEDLRGGSTITQQVAKNLFLWNSRSWVRKALEAPIALWMDLVLTKRRILELYLNIAELGPDGEFGAEAGARRAFNRSARDLSGYQAALLAASLPNPVTRNARSPGPGMRRLAGLYVGRAGRLEGAANCVLRRH
jgi:monofunctional biosynthetic peptidoglycan transglycosylase